VIFRQHQGVPQGGPFSPLLFELNINDLMTKLPIEAEASLFVDDLLVLTPYDKAQQIIRMIETESAIMGMEINYGPGKTELINPTQIPLNTKIREVDQYEYLGVTIKKTRGGNYDTTFAHSEKRARVIRTQATLLQRHLRDVNQTEKGTTHIR